MKRYLLYILLVFFCSVCQLFAQSEKDNYSLFLYGTQSELLGDYPSAKQLYDASVFRTDSSVYVPSLIGSLNLRLHVGDYGVDTEKYLNLAYRSGLEESYLTDMMIRYKLGKQEFLDAKNLCLKLLAANPEDKNILSLVPLIDYYLQSKDSVLIRINDYESKYGVDSRLYQVKREVLSELNLYDSLLNYNRRVYDLFPENLSVLADLANVETAVGNDSTAYHLWECIKEQDSTSIEFIAQRNFFYSTHGYKQESILTTAQLLNSDYIKPEAKQQIFSQMFIAVDPMKDTNLLCLMDSVFFDCYQIEQDSSYVVRDIVLGYFYFRNNYCECLNILSSLHNSLPSIPKYTIQTANFYTLSNNYDKAFSILDSAIIASPHVTDFVIYKAELLRDIVNPKASSKFIIKSIKQESADSSLSHYYSYLGDLVYKEGSHKTAFKYYELSLKHNPENPLALNNYAYFLALSNLNLDKALGMSHKCNLLVESNPTYLDTEAYILYKLKRYKEAKDMMDVALSIDANDISDEMLLHYADILSAMGNTILAKDFYQRALKAGADESLINERLNNLK